MRRILMKKRERPEQRSTTFTKRRNGLFTKAEELCVLCDAQIAMLVLSLKKKRSKIYSFGRSSVFDAFLNDDVPDAVDDKTKKSALSLYDESKALEHHMKNNGKNKEADSRYWWEVEDLDNIQSDEDVSLITDEIRRLRENLKIRLNMLKFPEIVTSGSNSANATTNYGDGLSQFDDDDGNKHDGLSQFDIDVGGTSGSTAAAAAANSSNHDNGNGHFKHDNNFIIINDNRKHDGKSQYDAHYEDFLTLTPVEFFNDYNLSLSSIYDSSFVNIDYNKTVPESASGVSYIGQIVEGNKQKYDAQQTVTSSASKYVHNFDQSYVGGEHNTKKVVKCMGVGLKDKEANSLAITAENLPNIGYLNQEVTDGVYNAKLDDYRASTDLTSDSILLNVVNNDAPLFTDSIRTLDCAYQSVNVNPQLSTSITSTAEYEELPLSNDWFLP